jgi:carotenoid cleavage dioxygenase
MDGADGNQFPFFPCLHEPFDVSKMAGNVTRLTVDLADNAAETYGREILYPEVKGVLARQDDRFQTMKYRYGWLLVTGPQMGWAMFDHAGGSAQVYSPGPDTDLAEMCFAPRGKDAPEGDGYVLGIANRRKENGRSDLLILDTRRFAEGPIATVKLPFRIVRQVHGCWTPGHLLG